MDKEEMREKIRDTIMNLINDETDKSNKARDAFHDVLQAKMQNIIANKGESTE